MADVQALRRGLLRSDHTIAVTDYGAGSRVNASRQRRVRDIVRNAEKPPRFGRLLYRLTDRFAAQTVFELGTSLGLTTACLARAAQPHGGRVTTFEGCPETAALAQTHFRQLGLGNVVNVVGNLDETLAPRVAATERIDLAFFDANHRYEPTLRYFELCRTRAHNDTVFVFDDIHWSGEMERAWAAIQAHPAVSVTVDLFWMGLVFFRREQPKQHYVLRF